MLKLQTFLRSVVILFCTNKMMPSLTIKWLRFFDELAKATDHVLEKILQGDFNGFMFQGVAV